MMNSKLLESLLQKYVDYINLNYIIPCIATLIFYLIYRISKEDNNIIQNLSLENRIGILSTKMLEFEKKFNTFKQQATFTLKMLTVEQDKNCNKIEEIKNRVSHIEELCYSTD